MTQVQTLGDAPTSVRPTARREVAVFLVTTFSLLAVSTLVGVAQGVDVSHIDDASPIGQLAMYGQASFPAIGAVVARATTARAERTPFGFRRPPARSIATAWGMGLGYVLLSALIVWTLGLAGFAGTNVGLMTLLGWAVLAAPYLLLALGEDLGWRGLLTTRLAQVSGPRTVVLFGGLVWGMFHWPLMLFLGGVPDGTAAWFALASFTVGVTALGSILSSMQLRGGIWPGLVMHAVLNATLYHVVGPLTAPIENSGYYAGETGIVTTAVLLVMAVAWWRRAPLRRTADDRTVAG